MMVRVWGLKLLTTVTHRIPCSLVMPPSNGLPKEFQHIGAVLLMDPSVAVMAVERFEVHLALIHVHGHGHGRKGQTTPSPKPPDPPSQDHPSSRGTSSTRFSRCAARALTIKVFPVPLGPQNISTKPDLDIWRNLESSICVVDLFSRYDLGNV